MIFFQKKLFHLRISSNSITREMNEGSSIHQLESMKDIVSILVDGIFIKFPGQNKLRMEFHG
jgi:hypothetical protein